MLCAIPLAMEIRGYFRREVSHMTQVVTPAEPHTTLTAVEGDGLFEIVEGQVVEKKPMGVYESVVGSFLHTYLDSFARGPMRVVARSVKRSSILVLVSHNAALMWPMCPMSAGHANGVYHVPKLGRWCLTWRWKSFSPSNTFGEVFGKGRFRSIFRQGCKRSGWSLHRNSKSMCISPRLASRW